MINWNDYNWNDTKLTGMSTLFSSATSRSLEAPSGPVRMLMIGLLYSGNISFFFL